MTLKKWQFVLFLTSTSQWYTDYIHPQHWILVYQFGRSNLKDVEIRLQTIQYPELEVFSFPH